MNQALTDFLNHGILPFIGREQELERLYSFWQETPRSGELRVALVTGEGGVGKSRIIEAVLSRVASAGGLPVHIKLHPESNAALAPLLARALWYSDLAGSLLKSTPEENMSSVIGALRRLARLRPLIVVIEDIHLLASDAVPDLALLLNSLAEEPMAVLTAARPLDLLARPLLERHLHLEMKLDGLDEKEIGSLWRSLFDLDATSETIWLLRERTAGNALALRMALRHAVHAGAIPIEGNGNNGERNEEALASTLSEKVRLFSEGMIAHLVEEERRATLQLALLGEVFSREAAAAMLPDADRMIDRLLFKGVLATTRRPLVPLISKESRDHPASASLLLSFSHSLVHETLIASPPDSIDRLISLLGTDLPLYSVASASSILKYDGEFSPVADNVDLLDATRRLLAIAADLNRGPDWKLGQICHSAAGKLAEASQDRWPEEDRLRMRLRLLTVHIDLLRRTRSSPERRAMMEEYIDVTEGPLPESLSAALISALSFKVEMAEHESGETVAEIWRNAAELLDRSPELRYEGAYTTLLNHLLATIVREGRDRYNAHVLEAIEEEIRRLLLSEEIPERSRFYLKYSLSELLQIHDTPEELESRRRLMAELESDPQICRTPTFVQNRIGLLDDTLQVDEGMDAIAAGLPLMQSHGLMINYNMNRLRRLRLQSILGADRDLVVAELAEILRDESKPRGVRPVVAGELLGITFALIGDAARALALRERLMPQERGRSFFLDVEYAYASNQAREELEDVFQAFAADPYTPMLTEYRGFVELFKCALGRNDADSEKARVEARGILRNDMLEGEKIVLRYCAITLIQLLDRFDPALAMGESLSSEIRESLLRMLEGFAERRLPVPIRSLLSRYADHLTPDDCRAWEAKAAGLERERSAKADVENDGGRIEISMLGVVEIRRPGEKGARIKGSRNRTLLALLTAAELLERPLDYPEFCSLASGIVDDYEQARRATNVAVHRLRELLGHDAVLTDRDVPRLNVERVEVDLVLADAALREATAALRDGNLGRALPALDRALEIAGGAVPFPTFYERFYEAAREDFEARLRSIVLKVAESLLREGDAVGAEAIGRRAFDSMPEDEELADLLRRALITQGKRTEAERVKSGMREKG